MRAPQSCCAKLKCQPNLVIFQKRSKHELNYLFIPRKLFSMRVVYFSPWLRLRSQIKSEKSGKCAPVQHNVYLQKNLWCHGKRRLLGLVFVYTLALNILCYTSFVVLRCALFHYFIITHLFWCRMNMAVSLQQSPSSIGYTPPFSRPTTTDGHTCSPRQTYLPLNEAGLVEPCDVTLTYTQPRPFTEGQSKEIYSCGRLKPHKKQRCFSAPGWWLLSVRV